MHKLFVVLVTKWQWKSLKKDVCVWNFAINLLKCLQRHFMFLRCNLRSVWRKGLLDKKKKKKRRYVGQKPRCFWLCFFNCKGIVHHEFVPRGQMVNKQLYQEVLARMRDAVRRKRPDCGETRLACCTTTMLRLTRRSSSAVIWQNIRRPLFPIYPILQT